MKLGTRVVIVEAPVQWRDLIGRRATVVGPSTNYSKDGVLLVIDGIEKPEPGQHHYQALIREVRPLNVVERIGEIDPE